MKKRLKKKLSTQSVKFKHKTPVKHKYHKWMVNSIIHSGFIDTGDIIPLYTVELQCQICGKRRSTIGSVYTAYIMGKFSYNYWVFSNINSLLGKMGDY